ncbi:MAG: hypothetical protein H6744_02000 [Deltaproteobacteria bacterium]|nr:hypothetical protein [Deltaproteobacteria bacterium]
MRIWVPTAAVAAIVLSTVTCRATAPAPQTRGPEVAAAPAPAPPRAAPAAPATPPQDQATMVKEGEKRVRAHLATEAADRPIALRTTDGPAGTKVVRGAIEGAYPGSGTRAVVVAPKGRVYGPRSATDLAALVRELGWLAKAPPAADLVVLADALLFDGSLAQAPKSKPAVALRGGTLVLDLTRVVFPSQAQQPVRVSIGAAGPAQVTVAGKPVSVEVSPAEELEAALASDDAAGMARGVQALRGSTDKRALAALARVSASDNEELGASALMAIGSSADAAAALEAAWSKLPAPKRDALKAMATELYGAEFSARLD